MSGKRSFRLERSLCPSCKSEKVHIVKSLKNILVVVIDLIIGFLFFPPFSYKLKCDLCGNEFKAAIDKC